MSQSGPQVIYRGQPWYDQRPEAEQELLGNLAAGTPVSGPDTRPSLAFSLVTADGELPVYAAGVPGSIAGWVGPHVRIRGKIVDLSAEGGSVEVWIGTIQRAV